MRIPFLKYQGTGNDFVMIDNREEAWERRLSTAQIARICHRRFGVGADGLILLSPSSSQDFRMIYYNSDGRESSMCGNGGRCIVAFARHLGLISDYCRFEAIDGLHEAWIAGDWVELKMNRPAGYRQLPDGASWIDTGSPHYVKVVEEPVADLDVKAAGREIRYSEAFGREGTNVNFVNVLGPGELRVRTYERGVEDETLSCGTGVTACAYTYLLDHPDAPENLTLHTEGGRLEVRVSDRGSPQEAVFLCGPANFVFEGVWEEEMGGLGGVGIKKSV